VGPDPVNVPCTYSLSPSNPIFLDYYSLTRNNLSIVSFFACSDLLPNCLVAFLVTALEDLWIARLF
jgi:hypothetical protein